MGPRRDRSYMSRTHQMLQRIPLRETELLKDYLIKNPMGHESGVSRPARWWFRTSFERVYVLLSSTNYRTIKPVGRNVVWLSRISHQRSLMLYV